MDSFKNNIKREAVFVLLTRDPYRDLRYRIPIISFHPPAPGRCDVTTRFYRSLSSLSSLAFRLKLMSCAIYNYKNTALLIHSTKKCSYVCGGGGGGGRKLKSKRNVKKHQFQTRPMA